VGLKHICKLCKTDGLEFPFIDLLPVKLASVATGINCDILIMDLVHADFGVDFGDSVCEPYPDEFIYHYLGSVRLSVGEG
jgi:hypothetical protein